MPVEVSVLSVKGHPPAEVMDASFDQEGGTIGRLPEKKDNHLFLPDPNRYISRIHAKISYKNGQFYLIDSSIDGTYLRNRDTCIHGASARIADGDRIWIGDYELVVRIHSADFLDATASAPNVHDPTQAIDIQEELTPSETDTPWWSNANRENANDHDRMSDTGHQQSNTPLDDAFSPPDVMDERGQAEQIPTDFNFEELIQGIDSSTGQHRTTADDAAADGGHEPGRDRPAKKNHRSAGAGTFPKDQWFTEKDDQRKPVPPATADLHGSPDPFKHYEKPGKTNPPPFQAADAAPVFQQQTDGDLFHIFLEAAGIKDTNRYPKDDLPHLMRSMGVVFREMVTGLVLLLKGRAEQKVQLRMSTTQMMPADNNPLKFFDDIDETIEQLLTGDKPGFVDPQTAVREGFAEIQNHHIAMTAGIQAAVIHLIEKFDPLRFSEQNKEGSVFSKKAKLWDAFQKAYAEIAHTALDDFFGEALSRAYEAQLSKLQHPSEDLNGTQKE